jgi:Sensors of blue-light using FAD
LDGGQTPAQLDVWSDEFSFMWRVRTYHAAVWVKLGALFTNNRVMLIRLIYSSTSVGPQTGAMTHAILKTAQAWNKTHGITGVLCQLNGVFLQALEGERSAVTKLYARIYKDRRHSNVEIIHCEGIAKRRYENWSMAHISLVEFDLQTKIKWPEFDPYSADGLKVMEHIDRLLASGTVITSPDN